MTRSRLFWKFFLGFTIVNLLVAFALVLSTWSWQKQEARALIERELATAAELLSKPATDWATDPSPEHADTLRTLARPTGLGIRVQRRGGEPLVIESNPPLEAGTVNETVHYWLNNEEQRVGELTVQRSGARFKETMARLWDAYAFFAPWVALLMIAAGYALVTHLIGPVRSLNHATQAMVAGDYRQRAFVANRDELGVLARSFNQMSEELGRRLSELQESDQRQATVLGGMIEGVIAIDGSQRVQFANAAAGKLFNFFPPQVEGRPLLEAVRNHSLHQATSAAIASRTPQRLEVDWEDHVLSVQVTPLVGEPLAGAIVVLHDTTELRRLENLRRDFVANVSHELKTPLSTIKANAETLLLGAVDDKQNRERFLRGIDEQADRLAELIQDMLQLARIESAQQPFEINTISVSAAVNACVEDHQQRAEAKQIEVTAQPAAKADRAQVRVDRDGLQVILNNLVDNAIKYTPEGGQVRIAWNVEPASNTVLLPTQPAAMVRLEVIDTGVGIPEEKLSRVFERFYRVDEARSRHLGGTGLGLSIVKHLTQSFGGKVTVENVPGGGAKFSVLLPAA